MIFSNQNTTLTNNIDAPDPFISGGCILDTNSIDGIGRFPSRHGMNANSGFYSNNFANSMWDAYNVPVASSTPI